MIVNYDKTKLMVFNKCKSVDFSPVFEFGNKQLEVVEEIRLLGVIIRSDLKWSSNTQDLRASNKLWVIRRLKSLGANNLELLDIYNRHCRSILEFGVPAWHSAITNKEKMDLETTVFKKPTAEVNQSANQKSKTLTAVNYHGN